MKLIDLAALKREAESDESESTVVSRRWLAQAYNELAAWREAQGRNGQMFGLKPEQRL